MFNRICNEVNTHNLYGFKYYTKNFEYTQYWRRDFTDKIIEKLKDHYTDSSINSINDTIYIDWSLPNDTNDKEDNVEISITLPSSRIRTRSSSKR